MRGQAGAGLRRRPLHDGGDQSTDAPPAQAKHDRVQRPRRRARLTSELASLMHPPSVPHQQQDFGARGRAWRELDGRGWYSESLITPYSGLSDLLLESSGGADDAPTDLPRLAGQDGTGTEWLPPARVRPQVRPNVTHVLTLPAPRHSPTIRPRPTRLVRSSKSCSSKSCSQPRHVSAARYASGVAVAVLASGRCGGPGHVESRPQLPGELPSQRTTTSCTLTRAI
jgi:hypothetical protein